MKTLFRVVLYLFGAFVIAIAAAVVAVNISPRPFAWLVNRQFAGGISSAKPANLDDANALVRVERDIEYPSGGGSNRLDVFTPSSSPGPNPTVFWIHGGGFVGGDKSDIETWATLIAAKGYTVISINYALAPAAVYPGPVVQAGEAYAFVRANPSRFPAADMKRLIIGGDSAGAQIASQFINLQTNSRLAASMGIEPVVPKNELLGAVLYCGPYDLRGLHDSGTWIGRFFVRQMGWSYFGVRDWRDSPQAAQATAIEHVTPDFPPTFITDGNTASFEPDARKLEAALKQNGVEVDSLYFPPSEGQLGHEYQFDFAQPHSATCLERTLAFLARATAR